MSNNNTLSDCPIYLNRFLTRIEQNNDNARIVMPLETTSNSLVGNHLLALKCRVCGAPAHGYNFDQITCESCKAFFRRNALRNTSDLKCRFSGCCEINITSRRQCTYCRLKKCFSVNMRKEWIRTDEERELRRLKQLDKQNKLFPDSNDMRQMILNAPIVARKKKRLVSLKQDQTISLEIAKRTSEPIIRLDIFGVHRNLMNNDQILINNITNAYKIASDQADCSHISRYTSSSTLTQFLNDESTMYQSLIYFYKYIPQFRQIDLNDQILLIKSNLVNIIHLHHIIVENFQENPNIGKHMSKWVSSDFHRQMSHTRKQFDYFMRYPFILKLTLIVFIFSNSLTLPTGNARFAEYKDKWKLYETQNFFIVFLWKYLNYLFDEKDAVRALQLITSQILRYQNLMDIVDRTVRTKKHDDIWNPLTQSVLGLT